MEQQLQQLRQEFQAECAAVSTAAELEALRIKYLGRKSGLAGLFAQMGQMSAEEKKVWGQNLNQFKNEMTDGFDAKAAGLSQVKEEIDLTPPPASVIRGNKHILSAVLEDICSIFERMGFVTAEGAEIEDDWHNFTALNFPQDHPSRDSFDTFYLDLPEAKKYGKHLLRCHTSPSQARVMEQYKPPLAVISPGRVYRPDQVDASHSFMFHQVEGFAVNESINFADLKGVLLSFARGFFSSQVSLRFRPHYFPFTEPSAEADVSCFLCGGKTQSSGDSAKKCGVCKGKGWLEVLGCGMIHPNVLAACGIDNKKYRGFAFGMGVDRLAMLKYGINDIRLLYDNDMRFLKQF